MSLVDYGHRGVPNVFLNAPLKSDGSWNAAHFKNSEYDKLVKQYVAALDLSTQRTARRARSSSCCWTRPRLIAPYWFDAISVSKNDHRRESYRPAWDRSSWTARARSQLKHHDVPVAARRRRHRSRRTRWRSTSSSGLGLALITLWILSMIVFLGRPAAARVIPGGRSWGTSHRQQARRPARPQLGVDRPLVTQYTDWVTNLAHGDMGDVVLLPGADPAVHHHRPS